MARRVFLTAPDRLGERLQLLRQQLRLTPQNHCAPSHQPKHLRSVTAQQSLGARSCHADGRSGSARAVLAPKVTAQQLLAQRGEQGNLGGELGHCQSISNRLPPAPGGRLVHQSAAAAAASAVLLFQSKHVGPDTDSASARDTGCKRVSGLHRRCTGLAQGGFCNGTRRAADSRQQLKSLQTVARLSSAREEQLFC